MTRSRTFGWAECTCGAQDGERRAGQIAKRGDALRWRRGEGNATGHIDQPVGDVGGEALCDLGSGSTASIVGFAEVRAEHG